MKILFKEDSLHNENFILTREWFEGNIHGCFGIQSISGINTKRYHGLFNLNLPEFEEPISILANIEENLIVDDFTLPFSSSQFSPNIDLKGYLYLKEFQYITHPQFNYEVKNIYFTKEILIHSKYNVLIFRYHFPKLPKRKKIKLIVKPFFTFKNILSFKVKDPSMSGEVYNNNDILEYRPYSSDFCLYMVGTDVEFTNSPLWFYNFYHALDVPKPSTEDYFNPGFFEFQLKEPGDYYLAFSTEPINSITAKELFEEEKKYRYEKLSSSSETELLRKSINLIFHKYFYFFKDRLFIKNSPLDNQINILDSLWALPGLLFYDKFLYISRKLKDSWEFLKIKNFLPDKFIYRYDSRVFETPLANLFYIIVAHMMKHFSDDAYTGLIQKSIIKDLMEAFFKDRFSGLSLKGDGKLQFDNPDDKFIWKNPFGLKSIPIQIEIDPYLLNLLWYNALVAYNTLDKPTFGLFRKGNIEHYIKSLKTYLENEAELKVHSYPILTKILLSAMPELPLPEDVLFKLRADIEENLTPHGLKVKLPTFNNVEVYVPVGGFIYLFHLKKHADLKEFKEKSGYYLTYFMDNLYRDTLMHISEAFIFRNGEIQAFGSNLSFINLSLAYFWHSTRLLLLG